uniref:40S ribosomal protein S24 n=1 Tax=Rhabditophanes sp. KR3021 TaxID=114890 RepID=A0AC35U856_9BILA
MVVQSSGAIVISTKKIVNNRLLNRKQMCVDILHPLKATVSKKDIREKIASLYKVTPDLVIPSGFISQIGGGRTSGFCKIYDSVEDVKKYEYKFMLARFSGVKVEKAGRKQRKERKNRQKKLSGTDKAKASSGKK